MRTKRVRLLALLMAIVLTVGLLGNVMPALAAAGAEPDVYQTYPNWSTFKVDGGGTVPRVLGHSCSYMMGGEAAYCLDPNRLNGPVVPSDNLEPEMEEALKAAISFGYSYKNHMFMGEPVDDSTPNQLECYFMATQVLVWEIAQRHRSPGDWSNAGITENSLNKMGKTGVAMYYHRLLDALKEYEENGRDPQAPFMPKGFYSTPELALKHRIDIDPSADVAAGRDTTTIDYYVGLENIQRYAGLRLYKGLIKDMEGFNTARDNEISAAGTDPQGKINTARIGMAFDGGLFPIISGSYADCGFFGVTAADGYLFLGFSHQTFTPNDIAIAKIWRPGANTPRTDGTLQFYDAEVSGKYQRRVQYIPAKPVDAVAYAAFRPVKVPDKIVKIWDDNGNADGKRPDSIKISVYEGTTLKSTLTVGFEADKKTPVGQTVGLFNGDKWEHQIEQELWYNKDATYTIVEEPVEGYTTVYSGLTVTNRMGVPKLRKVWNDNSDKAGDRPASVSINVVDNTLGKQVATITLGFQPNKTTPLAGTIGSFGDNEWQYDLTKAAWYTDSHTYTLIEAPVPGYQASVVGMTVSNRKAIEDKAPSFDFPSFDVRADKNDTKGGFDDNVHTPRGDGSLAATFRFDVSSKGGNLTHTDKAPHLGEYATYNGFRPWRSTNDADDVEVETSTCEENGAEYATYYKYTYTAIVTVTETVPPEGYFLEKESGGNGVRTIRLTYTMEAERAHTCIFEPGEPDEDGNVEDVHVNDELTPWQYTYSSTSSDTGFSTQAGTHIGELVGDLAFSNQIRRGQAQLVKTYNEDLDPFTVIGGVKPQMPGSWWTLELVSGEEGHAGAAGSENHPYVMLQRIAKGEPGFSVWGNSYRVVEDTKGSTQHAGKVFTADGGAKHDASTATEDNVLITGGATDLNGNKKGQLYIYDIPYGYYKMTEIRCVANEGYVLETYFFHVSDEGDTPSQEVNDEVIKNEIIITKRDSETGKIVPMAGTAFRIKYLGYYHTNPDTGKNEFMTNEHSGTYIKNDKSVDADDVYNYMFVTNVNGKIKIPYELEYGVWQLEEITAPPGYYIGDYSNGGKGESSDQTGGQNKFEDTVAIFDQHGNKIDYTRNDDILFNYYTFTVDDQTKTDPDGDGIYELNIVIKEVNAFNNATKGKIEIKKVAEQLVGFKETSSDYGTVTTPIYEMQPMEGAKFEVVAAGDIIKNDGHNAPDLYDALGKEIVPELIQLTHSLWPNVGKTERAILDDGAEAYILTTRESENDGKPNSTSKSATNTISANLMTPVKGGVEYKLKYETDNTDPVSGITTTCAYDITIGLEYAAGGWNYSYIDVVRTATASDYLDRISKEMPVVTYGGQKYDLSGIEVGTINLPDGSSIKVNETLDTCVNQVGYQDITLPLDQVRVENYRPYMPLLDDVPAHKYLSKAEALTLEIPADYSSDPTDPTIDNVSTEDGYCYTNGIDFIHAAQDPDTGEQYWATSDSAAQQTVQEYTNAPDSDSTPGGAWHVREISAIGDKGISFTGDMFVATMKGTEYWYIENMTTKTCEWIASDSLAYAMEDTFRSSYDVAPPTGFVLSTINFEFGYLAWSDAESTWAILVRVRDTGELKWVRCSPEREAFITRTEHVRFDLNEANVSTGGFRMDFGGFVLKNAADTLAHSAMASMTNPSDEQPTLRNGAGFDVTTSEDGKTTVVKVSQPEHQAFWALPDGTKVSATYLGGYTKTVLNIPIADYLPSITYRGKGVEYHGDITPKTPTQRADLGGGNYVETVYEQIVGSYTITIVSNAKTPEGGFLITYSTGQTGSSIVVNDPEAGTIRGLLNVTTISKTLVYQTGHVIETLATDRNGVAYSKELPLGTYYVREVDAGLGYAISTDTHEVKLEYAGQYIPLVWGAAAISNAALDVNIDIAKGFQEAQGSDRYVYKAGAVFGVYNSTDIRAASVPADIATVQKDTATKDSMMSVITIGDDGFATATLKLPYGNDFYIKELDTLDGYAVSDVKYLFRVDEQAIADNLKFRFTGMHDGKEVPEGITGEINQTDLFETTIIIDTLYQFPAKHITVNGVEVVSDMAILESIAGASFIENEVMADKARLVIRATNSAPTVIQFENGAAIMLNVFSDGYTAVFTPSADTDVNTFVSKGNVGTTSIREEQTSEGVKYTYNPVVAYTGYTVDVNDAYRVPSTVMTTKDGVRTAIVFNSGSGKRTLVLTYPENIGLPDITKEQTWLTLNKDARAVVVDMDALIAAGKPGYEYKVAIDKVVGKLDAVNAAYVVTSDKALSDKDVIAKTGVIASFNGNVTNVMVDAEQLSALNTAIVEMNALEDKTTQRTVNVLLSAKNTKGNIVSAVVAITLLGGEATDNGGSTGAKVSDERVFFTYGESIVFDLTANSFTVTTAGKACSDPAGTNKDGVIVTYAAGNSATTLSHRNEIYTVSGEDGTSAIRTMLNHDNSVANVYVDAGTIVSAYNGAVDVSDSFTDGYPVSRGQVLTLVASDKVLYTVKLDARGVFNLHAEAIIKGVLEEGDNAPSATLNGTKTYTNLRASVDTTAEFGETITYRRSSNMVSAISVKVNSTSDNTSTGGQENGSESGRPDQIPNDIIVVEFEKEDMEGRHLAGAVIAVYDLSGREVWRGMTGADGIARWEKAVPGEYTFCEVVAPTGYQLNSVVYPLTVYKNGTVSGNLTILNEKTPEKPTPPDVPEPPVKPKPVDYTINKVDAATKEGIPGAQVEVLDSSKTRVIASGVTDKYGRFSFSIPVTAKEQLFWFHETVAPQGYILNEAWFSFTVKNGKASGDNTIPNERAKTYIITKTDVSTSAGIPGAKIEITNWDKSAVIASGYTDSKGEYEYVVPADGIYWFHEVVAPNGYILNEAWFSFTMENGVARGDNNIPNERTKVIIRKEDVITAQGVPGATIEVTDSDGDVVTSGKSDEKGFFGFYRPDPGVYYFHEVIAPNGYILNEKFFSFTVNADLTITGDDTITNVPNTIIVHKQETITKVPIGGATIEFYDESGLLLQVCMTDKDGNAYFAAPKLGTYIYREVLAPEGYILDEGTHTITIHSDGTITGDRVFVNTPYIPRTGVTDYVLPLLAAAGAMLVALSAITFITRKRKKNE